MTNQENQEQKNSKKKYLLLLLLLLPLLIALALFIPRCQNEEEKYPIKTEDITNQEDQSKETPSTTGLSLGINASPSAMKPGMYSTIKIKIGNYNEEELEIYSLKLIWSLNSNDIETEIANKNSIGWKLDHNLQNNEKIDIYEENKTLNDLGTWTLHAIAETNLGEIDNSIDIEVRN